MSRRKEISNQIYNLITSDCRNNLNYWTIAKKYSVSKSAVEKIYKKYAVHKTVENLRGHGHKRKITVKEDRIIRNYRQNPRIASRDIVC